MFLTYFRCLISTIYGFRMLKLRAFVEVSNTKNWQNFGYLLSQYEVKFYSKKHFKLMNHQQPKKICAINGIENICH